MPLQGEEIRRRLTEFAEKWTVYGGSERAEAQTFLNQLFACYGTERESVASFEAPQHGRFLDLIWPRTCLIEMKRPSEANRLADHRAQAFDYWRHAADADTRVPAPRYVVICAFRRFEIWELGAFPNAPRADFELVDLPDRADALMFLAGKEPVFLSAQEGVTREAVSHVTGLYQALRERRAAGSDVLRNLVLQSVWCMFAEDLGQLEGHTFTRIIDDLIANPQRSSADDLGGLFKWLNTPGARPPGGLYAETRYVNGGLFEHPAHVHLGSDELVVLREACAYDWKRVEPHIFGSLLEGALGKESQWALGAHYTHEVDILKVIRPSIVDPWNERIDSISTHVQARQLQSELSQFVVLDPACGSGNFLYIAYREMRRLEKRLQQRERELRKQAGLRDQESLSAFFPLHNIRGIEINAFAVALARVTLWMGHKLAVDELDLDEATLPLEDLSGIQVGDALRTPWPRSSVVIGNPPYHGTKDMRRELGDAYVKWLDREFGVGVKDHCVYWFRLAQRHLQPGQRAGFVATNSIAEGKNREATLDHLLADGSVITNAVRSQVWPGAANVHVSIVNWIKQPGLPPPAELNAEPVSGITSELKAGSARYDDAQLIGNRGKQFFGVVPGGQGFVLATTEAEGLLSRDEAHYREVVRPYLIGDDITSSPGAAPTRWIIDFGERRLEEAEQWPAALAIVRARVKPLRDAHKKQRERTQWWKLSRTVRALFDAVAPLDRFVACPATSKRILMTWCQPHWVPGNATSVFAFQEDYAFGVLTSSIHRSWALGRTTHLKSDPRYTVNAFATFPWPSPTQAERDSIAAVAREIDGLRQRVCLDRQIGLTTLYNAIEEGGYEELQTLHRDLDVAVGDAYGWPEHISLDPLASEEQLSVLNREIATGSRGYDPFAEGDPGPLQI